MLTPSPDCITLILGDLHAGDGEALQRLLQVAYTDLRRLARGFLHAERADHSWQATDLVHEAVARLLGAGAIVQAQSREHFFGIATRAMRQLLVEHVRLRKTVRRGGGEYRRMPMDLLADYFERQNIEIAAVRDALERLSELNERQGQVMTLRYFGGFTVGEIASQLGISVSTVESDWRIARAWLHAQLT